ncbi:MAG TPA: hypothetical protein PKE39_00995 [Ignavibacteria bacterium]|nr:hypothetical protein [Ignavibacteria bacterium]HMQ97572.1 hypothetical protein [Ignavibacteria bacterium]
MNHKNAMKIISYLLAILVITGSVFYYGCDDAGKIPVQETAGQIKFTQNVKLPPLDPVNDGYYNLFIILTDSFGTPRASHLGRFNTLTNGDLVDPNGNPMTLSINPNDTIDLGRALYSIISIDIGVVNQPGPTRIVAGPVTVLADSVTSRLRINDTAAIGSAMTSALGPNSVFYIVNAPTGSSPDCGKGLWFCDENGALSWPGGSALTPGWGWQYHGYVRNKTTGELYHTGTFYDPDNFDSDGAGPCADTLGTAYSKPGQDWVKSGCSNITNILDGNHETFVTLEPEFRSGSVPPFVLKLYYQNIIIPGLNCNRHDNMFTQRQNIPDVSIRITR